MLGLKLNHVSKRGHRGPFQYKDVILQSIGISIIKIRWSHDRLKGHLHLCGWWWGGSRREIWNNWNHWMCLRMRGGGRQWGGNRQHTMSKWLPHPFSPLQPQNREIPHWQQAPVPLWNCVYVNADAAAQQELANSHNTVATPPHHRLRRCKCPFILRY